MSLRAKLTLVGTVLMAVLGTSLAVYFYAYSRHLMENELTGKGEYIVQNLSHNARYPIFTRDKVLLSTLIDGVFEEPDAAYVVIVDERGSLLMSRFRRDVPRDAAQAILASLLRRPPANGLSFINDFPAARGLYDHFESLVFNVENSSQSPVSDVLGILKNQEGAKRIIGAAYVGLSVAPLSLSLRKALGISILIFLITSVAGAVSVNFTVERTLRPLRQVTRTSGEIARGEFSKRVLADSKDEIGELALSFNHMADSLQSLMRDLSEKRKQLEENNEALSSLNAELEQRVKDRTREIYQANQKLEGLVRELEAANRVTNEFLANTSHELRTPLNAIIGFLGLVREGAADSRQEELEFVKHAYESGKHLLGLINDILDVAKIEAGKIEIHLEEIEVRDAVSMAVDLCRGLVEKKELRLNVDLQPDLPTVRADRSRLVQVLSNLLSNAVKFTERGEIIVQGISLPESGFVEISVKDTGIGIPLKKEDQAQLFEKFRQVDGVYTRKAKGTGLGLSIAKSFVEMMGGAISIESEGPEKGTIVSFTLPVAESHSPSAPFADSRR